MATKPTPHSEAPDRNATEPPAISPQDLRAVMEKFNETSVVLREWNNRLQDEVRRLNGELHQKNIELERKNRLSALGEMAAGVAHEIRNPLGGISLYASLLERALADEPEKLRLIAKISDGIRNLNTIVEDMLSFTSNRPLEKKPVAIDDVIDAALKWAPADAENFNVEIRRENRAPGVVVDADAERLARSFLNIVLNAFQAMENDGTLTIGVEKIVAGDAEFVRTVFSDTGPGIPNDVADKIFNPFFTTRDKGVGLGLAIVHRTVEEHGGFIGIESSAAGAKISVTLPAVP